MRSIARCVISLALLLMLFVPVLAAFFITSTNLKLSIVMLSSGVFISVLAIVAGARTTELFVAGAT